MIDVKTKYEILAQIIEEKISMENVKVFTEGNKLIINKFNFKIEIKDPSTIKKISNISEEDFSEIERYFSEIDNDIPKFVVDYYLNTYAEINEEIGRLKERIEKNKDAEADKILNLAYQVKDTIKSKLYSSYGLY